MHRTELPAKLTRRIAGRHHFGHPLLKVVLEHILTLAVPLVKVELSLQERSLAHALNFRLAFTKPRLQHLDLIRSLFLPDARFEQLILQRMHLQLLTVELPF